MEKEKYYLFTIQLGGWGYSLEEAWEVCKEAFDIEKELEIPEVYEVWDE